MQETWVRSLSWEDPLEKGKYLLQYSGMGNSTDCIVHGVAKSRTWLSNFRFHYYPYILFPQFLSLGQLCPSQPYPRGDGGRTPSALTVAFNNVSPECIHLIRIACLCALWFSCVWFFATPWTVACQAPLSMGFSRQEYWSGLPFCSPRDLSDTGTNPYHLHLLRWLADSVQVSHLGDSRQDGGSASSFPH